KSNLKQLALACHNYEAHTQSLPPAGRGYGFCASAAGGTGDRQVLNLSGWMLVLPYIEQSTVYQQCDMNLPFCDVIWDNGGVVRNNNGIYTGPPWNGATGGASGATTINMALMNLKLPLFVCPSDGGPRDSTAQGFPNRYGVATGLTGQRTNYDFITD